MRIKFKIDVTKQNLKAHTWTIVIFQHTVNVGMEISLILEDVISIEAEPKKKRLPKP
jgi:hypothetical protein